MIEVEEAELEPSLATEAWAVWLLFLDSIGIILGLNGDGVGLNYHLVFSNRF